MRMPSFVKGYRPEHIELEKNGISGCCFLEKFNEPPKQIDLSADSVDAIFSGAELAGWKDKDIFEAYLAQIDIDENEYRAF